MFRKQVPSLPILFLLFLLPLEIIAGALASFLIFQDMKTETEILTAHISFHLGTTAGLITDEFTMTASDLDYISSTRDLQDFIETRNADRYTDLTYDWKEFSDAKARYDQIRYLDETGMERLRINYAETGSVIVPMKELQNKADRYYFQETMRYPQGVMYVSPLDLNIENGVLENPLKPVIRFALPVFDSTTARRGIVIVNFLGKQILERVSPLDFEEKTFLVNSAGYFLKSPVSQDEWGFMRSAKNKTFSSAYPSAGDVIGASKTGLLETSDGLFIWITVNPLKNIQSRVVAVLDSESGISWKLISLLPRKRLDQIRLQAYRPNVRISIFIAILIGLFSFFLARQIRDRLKIQAALAESEAHYRLLAENSADIIWTLDTSNGLIQYISPSIQRVLGVPAKDLQGRPFYEILSPATREKTRDEFKAMLRKRWDRNGEKRILEVEFQRADTSVLTAEINLSRLTGSDEKGFIVLGVSRDITERKNLEVKLRELSEEDAMLGIFNRRKLKEVLEKEMRVSRRYARPLTLIMFDIDHFKNVNDTYGHDTGDAVLLQVSNIVKRILRDTDQFFRYGGEEFVVLAPETALTPGVSIAEKIRKSIEAETFPGTGNLTVSLGVAAFMNDTGQTSFLKRADEALYTSKNEGRNRTTIAQGLVAQLTAAWQTFFLMLSASAGPSKKEGRHTKLWGINFKFMLFILLVTVCFLVAIFFTSFDMLKTFSLQSAEELSMNILDGTDSRVLTLFENLESLAHALASTQVVKRADPEGMRDLFISAVLAWKRYLRAIYLGTADGRMYEWGHGTEFLDFTPTFPPGYDPRVRPWYQSALAGEGFSVSPPYQFASVDASGITCVLQVKNDEGRLVGVLGLDILLDNLKTILAGLDIPYEGRALLLGDSGEVIAGGFDHEDVAGLSGRLLNSTGSFTLKVRGEDILFSYRRSDPLGWFLLVGLPHKTIMQSVRWILTLITIIEILLMGMLTIALSLISNKLITAPLHEIVSVINRIEGGERTARVRITSRDEFALLGNELNKLVDTVEGYSASLETKVRERTEELQSLQQENTRLRILEERKRIYRDMHDSLGAKLTNIFFCNNVARSASRREPEKLEDLFQGIEENCLEAVRNLKEIVGGMREEEKSSQEFSIYFSEGIRSRLRHKMIGFTCRMRPSGITDGLDTETKNELTKVFDELVSNVLKHSGARRVSLSLRQEGNFLHIQFKDDGRGFDPEKVASQGSGLENINFRIRSLGGEIKTQSSPDKGVTVMLNVPFQKSLKETL